MQTNLHYNQKNVPVYSTTKSGSRSPRELIESIKKANGQPLPTMPLITSFSVDSGTVNVSGSLQQPYFSELKEYSSLMLLKPCYCLHPVGQPDRSTVRPLCWKKSLSSPQRLWEKLEVVQICPRSNQSSAIPSVAWTVQRRMSFQRQLGLSGLVICSKKREFPSVERSGFATNLSLKGYEGLATSLLSSYLYQASLQFPLANTKSVA